MKKKIMKKLWTWPIIMTFKKNYKLIAIDLSKQSKLKDPQQTNFIGKFENQDHWAAMFFINQKSERTTFNLLQNSVTII